MLNLYILNVDFNFFLKCIHMGFHFVALILNNTMVQTESKTDLRFERKMHFMVANQLNHHPLDQPYCDNCHPMVETVHSSLPPARITAIHFRSTRILKWKFNSKTNFQKMYRFSASQGLGLPWP